MKRRKIIGSIIAAVIVIGILVGAWVYIDSLAYKVCRVEAGVEVVPSDFLKSPDETAYFTEKSEAFSVNEPGEYHIKVKSGWFTHSCTLYVEDTQRPQGTAQAVTLKIGEICTAESFVTEVEDATHVEIAFVEEPDFSKGGSQTVTLTLTDLGNNVTTLVADLFISQVQEEVSWEVGSEPPTVEDFLVAAQNAEFVTDISAIDKNRPGDYTVTILADGISYESVLHMVDTVAPEGEVQNVSGYTLVPRAAEEFVVWTQDVTNVTISFVQEPDITMTGTQMVEISLTDEGGNQTIKQAELILEADTEEPVLTGVQDITIYMGDTISYRKGVEATDNCPKGLTLEVDNSAVDPATAGVYTVTYTATDLAGNQTVQEITVTIMKRTHTQEEIDALADAVLAKIITPEMTQLEIVQAIYNYNTSHIGYISYSEKGDWIQAAYEGLAERKGDCYVYACTAKQLLTRAGITNMDIAKIPAKTQHFWNLVDIGDGWYHFDTTPRKDHPTIFMWTDEQLMEYSAQHWNSHNYDHSLYPTVN